MLIDTIITYQTNMRKKKRLHLALLINLKFETPSVQFYKEENDIPSRYKLYICGMPSKVFAVSILH